MIRRKLVTRRNRKRPDPSNRAPASTITATVTTTGTTNVTVTFNQPVSVNGTFGITVDGDPCTGQVVVSATQITLVASGAVTGTDWVIPANDPAVRNLVGGYVAAATGTFL